MKLKLLLCALIFSFNTSLADARIRGAPFALAENPALWGINGFDSSMFPFVNLLKMASSFPTLSGTTFIFPNNLLQGSNLPNGSISTRMGFSAVLPSTYSGHYVFAMRGTIGGNGVQFATNGSTNQPGTVYSKSAGTTLSGCSAGGVPPCTFTALNITGTDIQIEFDNAPAISSLLFNWAAGSTWSGMTSAVLCKVADFSADSTCSTTSGKPLWAGGFNDDFVTSIAALRPSHIRMLDVNQTLNTGVPGDWSAWQTTSAWNYNLQNNWWAISNWFGSNSGTNSYSIACSNGQACTYLLTAGAPANGDFVQFYNVNANTNNNPTITVTDANAVTSAAIPLFSQGGTQAAVTITGTATPGDTISLTFTTTPVGGGSCLAGNTRTTAAYTVGGGDTLGIIANGLYAIVNADATLSAQNTAVFARNPNGGSGSFQVGWANKACGVVITANVTGAATETVLIGPVSVGGLAAQTLYTATYSSLLGAFIIANANPAAGGMGASWPWIVQLQLAQAVSTKSGYKVGCWLQPSILWSNASFTSLANLAANNQCPGGTKFELGNELWNTGAFFTAAQAIYLANSVGLRGDSYAYYELRQRQLWAIASTAFGGLTGNLHTISAWQVGGTSTNQLNGTTLCGTSCSNQAYQNAIGTDYTVASGNGTPASVTRHLSQAPYYHGGVVSGNYSAAAGYGSWSATSSSVASNVLTVSGTVTGTIWPNQGIAGCIGTYIAPTTPTSSSGFPTSQLTGTVTTTLNGAVSDNTHTWTLTSNAGLSAGMWIYNATTGTINATIVAVLGGNQITAGAAGTGKTYRSAGANDTIIFGGKAGTYRLNSTSCAIGSSTITGGDVLGLQYAADNYCTASAACATGNTGLGSVQDAYNWFAQDIIAAPKNNQSDQGVSQAGNIWQFQQIGGVATTLGIDSQSYEGGYDGFGPTTSQATSMGLPSSSYGMTGNSTTPVWDGYVNLALLAFKNSATFKTIATTVTNQELAWEPAGSMAQWYVFSMNRRWSLYNDGPGIYGTPYQSYNAICAYNGNPC